MSDTRDEKTPAASEVGIEEAERSPAETVTATEEAVNDFTAPSEDVTGASPGFTGHPENGADQALATTDSANDATVVAPANAEPLPVVTLSDDERAELVHSIEAVLFAAGEPLLLRELQKIFERLWDDTEGMTPERSAALSDGLKAAYKQLGNQAKAEAEERRGFALVQVAEGLTFRSNPRYAHVLRAMREEKPARLSQASLETLAIVAYRQPVTKPEVDQIRGVDCGGTLRLLLDRNLIRIVGKKDEPGRPMLYGTTREFLSFFNLGNLAQLPTLREFHELNQDSQEELRAFEETMPALSQLSENAKKLRLDEEPAVAALDEAVAALTNQESTTKNALLAEGIVIDEAKEGEPAPKEPEER